MSRTNARSASRSNTPNLAGARTSSRRPEPSGRAIGMGSLGSTGRSVRFGAWARGPPPRDRVTPPVYRGHSGGRLPGHHVFHEVGRTRRRDYEASPVASQKTRSAVDRASLVLQNHGMSRVPPSAVLAVGLLCACLLLGSGDRGRDPLRASLVPAMPREIAWHLVYDSDEDFTRYCDRVGYMDLACGIEGFRQAVSLRDPERSTATYRALRPYWKRLADQLERLYGVSCHTRDLERRDRLSVGDRVHLALLEANRDTMVIESRPGPRAAADSMQRIIRWADDRGLELLALGATAALVDLSLNLGQPEASRGFMRDGIVRARRCGDYQGLCQLLGRYPAAFPDSLRHTDSLLAMRVEALEIARSHRLIDQISRLLSFR